MLVIVRQFRIERRFDGLFRLHRKKLIEVGFSFKAFDQNCCEYFEFLFGHSLPVFVAREHILNTQLQHFYSPSLGNIGRLTDFVRRDGFTVEKL